MSATLVFCNDCQCEFSLAEGAPAEEAHQGHSFQVLPKSVVEEAKEELELS